MTYGNTEIDGTVKHNLLQENNNQTYSEMKTEFNVCSWGMEKETQEGLYCIGMVEWDAKRIWKASIWAAKSTRFGNAGLCNEHHWGLVSI